MKQTSLRDSYAKKIANGEKEYKPLKTKQRLQTRTTLKIKTNMRTVYGERVKNGEKKKYNYKPKPVKSKEQYKSFLTNDLYHCYITGDGENVHIHHIFGASNKTNSEIYGFIVPLRADWHNMADYGIHFNRELELKFKRLCQEYWLQNYGTKEEFIKLFGKWW